MRKIKRISGQFPGWFILISLIVLMTGCGSGGVSSSDPAKVGVVQTPAVINTTDLPDGTLKTYLTIDNEPRKEISLVNNNFQFSLAEFAQGEHDFLIEFEFTYSAKPVTLTLATATIKVNLVQGNTAITFVEADYSFPDSNNDGKTNLAALKENLDPQACVLGSSKLGGCTLAL